MKNILLLAMSTLPGEIKDHYYSFENEEPFPAQSQLEPITHWLVNKRREVGEKLDKVIILETNATVESDKGQPSAVDFYKKRVGSFATGIEYVDIRIDENNPEEGISSAIRAILQEFKEESVKLWIDTQGGFRDVVMVFNAIISLLIEQGIEPEGIYSVRFDKNNTKENPCQIIDQTKKYSIFKFVSYMQEFIDFGKATGLKKYFEKNYVDKIEFVQMIDEIADAIQMCQPQKFEEALRKFAEYLHSGEWRNDVPYLQIFVEFMKSDYGKLLKEPENTVEQIRWCVRKEFYQQAITIYIERMPKYYYDHGIIELSVNPKEESGRGQSPYAKAFYEKLFDEMLKDPDDETLNTILESLADILNKKGNAGKNDIQRAKGYLTEQSKTRVLTQNVDIAIKKLIVEMDERFDSNGDLRVSKDGKANKVSGYINALCGNNGMNTRYQLLYNKEREKEETYGKKIRAIEEAKTKKSDLVKHMEYYLAMKLLRNRMNHASEDKIEPDEQKAIHFLKSEGIDIGIGVNNGEIEVDYKKIKDMIENGLKCIELY